MFHQSRGIFLVILSAVAFGCMGTLAKFIYAIGVTPLQLLFVRFSISTLFMFPLLFFLKRSLKTSLESLGIYLILGLCYVATGYLFFFSVSRIDASVVALILAFYPAWVCMISVFFYKEKLDKKKALLLILSLIAVTFISAPSSGKSLDYIGVVAAFGSSLSYTFYARLLDSKKIKNTDSLTTTFYILLFSCIILFPLSFFQRGMPKFSNFSINTWIIFIALALFSTNIAIFSFYIGVQDLGSMTASILSNFEAIVGVILPIVIWHEQLTLLQWIGSVILIYSIVHISLIKNIK